MLELVLYIVVPLVVLAVFWTAGSANERKHLKSSVSGHTSSRRWPCTDSTTWVRCYMRTPSPLTYYAARNIMRV